MCANEPRDGVRFPTKKKYIQKLAVYGRTREFSR